MNRQEKETVVELLRDNMAHSQGMFLVGYRGLSVPKMESLRVGLRNQGGILKVSKARLMKKAVEGDSELRSFADYFKDQVALVFASGSVPGVAKALQIFAKENEGFEIIVGRMDHRLLTKDAVLRVAALPSREVLLAQLCGVLNAPIAGLARVLDLVAKQKEQNSLNMTSE
jgi:large subunit ribosomal protein L10